jgi:hypothetical protein
MNVPENPLTALLTQQVEPSSVPADHWPPIIETALAHDLAPMLYWVVKQSNAAAPAVDLDRELWRPVKSAALQTAAQYEMYEDVLKQADTALRAAGIPALWLKGSILANTVYPRPWTRPMADLDVLTPYQQRHAALQALERSGFQKVDDPGHLWSPKNAGDIDNNHHFVLQGGPGRTVTLELHYWLLSAPHTWMSEAKMTWFHQQTREIDIDAGRVLTLKPEAHLLYLMAHAQLQHGENELSHLHTLDVYLAITREAIDWDLLVTQAAAFGWTYAAARALRRVRQYFYSPALDLALPLAVLQTLHDLRPVDEDPTLITCLDHKGARWEKARRSMTNLSLGEKLRMILHMAVPPPTYMRIHYNIAAHRSLIPSYILRWADQATELRHWLGQRRNELN